MVVCNPNSIADMCETLRPVPHNLFAPSIENSVEDLKSLVYGKMHRLYGEMFEAMIQAIREETVRRIFLARIQTNEELKREKVAKEAAAVSASDKTVKQQPVRKAKKVGPNDPCPCGSGKKYKKCCRDKDIAEGRA